MELVFRNYQNHALEHIIRNPYAGLFLDMGLGKTAIIEAAIDYFLYTDLCIKKPLIIAPYNVADSVWTGEAEKWDEFKHLKLVKIMGSVNERLAALKEKGDIFIINRENVAWLVTHYQTAWPFDMGVFDESSSFKSADSNRFRAIRMVIPFMKRRIILTGTPAPNGLADLWSQIYLLDQGQRLGKTLGSYRSTYLRAEKQHGYHVQKWRTTEDDANKIHKKIEDICISMQSEDYLELPERIEIDHKINFTKELKKRYSEFEKTSVLEYIAATTGQKKNIVALNAASLSGKLLQFASGAIYDSTGKIYEVIHDLKLDLIEELIEAAQGEPVLISYNYRHEVERMMKRFGGHIFKKGDVDAWNRKEFPIMYLNPKAGGHGLNLQAGGCEIIWTGPTFNLEDWLQLNKRIHRFGQEKPVKIHKIRIVNTMDVKAYHSLDIKDRTQNSLMDAVKALVKQYAQWISFLS